MWRIYLHFQILCITLSFMDTDPKLSLNTTMEIFLENWLTLSSSSKIYFIEKCHGYGILL